MSRRVFRTSLLALLLIPLALVNWRLAAGPAPAAALALPVGQAVVKITVSADGVYQIGAADLAAAGVDLAAFNPQTAVIMHRGQPVAIEWRGDEDGVFAHDEAIRFYGQAFSGGRYERQFVSENVYWLWDGGAPARIKTVDNLTASYPAVKTSAVHTHTVEIDQDFFSTWTDQWALFDNEPDAWYWDRLPRSGVGLANQPFTYTIPILHPHTGGSAKWLMEFTSRARAAQPGAVTSNVTIRLNDGPTHSQSWNGRRNVNVQQTISAAALRHGDNDAVAVVTTPDVLYLNRISLTYPRQLIAAADELHFTDDAGGHTLQVSGLSEGRAEQIIVWDVTDAQRPLRISLTPAHVSGSGPYTLSFTAGHPVGSRYVVAAADRLRPPDSLTVVTPGSLEPPPGGANWLAITHHTLRPAAERLAAHRAAAGYRTHIVDVADVIAHFGHGLPLPEAIRAFLRHASAEWETPPAYVTLFGDATVNPRRLPCRWSCTGAGWDAAEPTLVPTDLLFVDRFQGLIPSDFALALLDDDLLPDVAIGRISAGTLPQAQAAVDKIIDYAQNQARPAQRQQTILFVADAADEAGDFCAANRQVGETLPASWPQRHLCLPPAATAVDVAQLRAGMFKQINDPGAFMLNYRGHGSIQRWGGAPPILSVAETDSSLGAWLNEQPTVILSADCLDGHFAWPGAPSISETLLTQAHAGTAAHWSSAGLGTDAEHTRLHLAFYAALRREDVRTMGNAIRHAQETYAASGAHPAVLYAFTLQGDPALPLWWADLTWHFLPLVNREP